MFNSLQTGKHIQKHICTPYARRTFSFNSLQTGKHIQRLKYWRFPSTCKNSFKFPSNGKAYPKFDVCISNEDRGDKCCFNSLQTGKHIQSWSQTVIFRIPLMFQFPSNGKAYPKVRTAAEWLFLTVFQFPSNGKAYPKPPLNPIGGNKNSAFQFPSNGESISKDDREPRRDWCQSWQFQFPSNGKAYPKQSKNCEILLGKKFQFPSNGESISKVTKIDYEFRSNEFQFPSNGKAYPKVTTIDIGGTTYCFNSLQTGKHIQSGRVCLLSTLVNSRFNSLQTGKPISKVAGNHINRPIVSKRVFNSLQTGKAYPKGKNTLRILDRREGVSNSLQTGKHIQSDYDIVVPGLVGMFQFPSNGESISKVGMCRAMYGLGLWVSIPFKRESISKVHL